MACRPPNNARNCPSNVGSLLYRRGRRNWVTASRFSWSTGARGGTAGRSGAAPADDPLRRALELGKGHPGDQAHVAHGQQFFGRDLPELDRLPVEIPSGQTSLASQLQRVGRRDVPLLMEEQDDHLGDDVALEEDQRGVAAAWDGTRASG